MERDLPVPETLTRRYHTGSLRVSRGIENKPSSVIVSGKSSRTRILVSWFCRLSKVGNKVTVTRRSNDTSATQRRECIFDEASPNENQPGRMHSVILARRSQHYAIYIYPFLPRNTDRSKRATRRSLIGEKSERMPEQPLF